MTNMHYIFCKYPGRHPLLSFIRVVKATICALKKHVLIKNLYTCVLPGILWFDQFTSSPCFFRWFLRLEVRKSRMTRTVLMVRVMRMIRNAFKLETPDRVPKVLGRRRFNWNEDQRLILAEGGAKKKKRPKIGEFWYHGALNSLTYCTRNCDWRPTLMSAILLPTHCKYWVAVAYYWWTKHDKIQKTGNQLISSIFKYL